MEDAAIHWHHRQGMSLGPYEGKVFGSCYCQKFQDLFEDVLPIILYLFKRCRCQ